VHIGGLTAPEAPKVRLARTRQDQSRLRTTTPQRAHGPDQVLGALVERRHADEEDDGLVSGDAVLATKSLSIAARHGLGVDAARDHAQLLGWEPLSLQVRAFARRAHDDDVALPQQPALCWSHVDVRRVSRAGLAEVDVGRGHESRAAMPGESIASEQDAV